MFYFDLTRNRYTFRTIFFISILAKLQRHYQMRTNLKPAGECQQQRGSAGESKGWPLGFDAA
jgi:hypothetical protein